MILRFVNALVAASTFVGAVFLVLMMVLIVVDVITTNLFGLPLPAASVVVKSYFMVLVVFVPMAWAQRTDAHVVVDVVYQAMSPGLRLASDLVSSVITLGTCGALVHVLWIDAVKKTEIGAFIFEQNVRVPTWPGYYALPIGFGLMALVILVSPLARRAAGRATEAGDGK